MNEYEEFEETYSQQEIDFLSRGKSYYKNKQYKEIYRIFIVYAGEIVESGNVKDVYLNTKHPYTKGLFNSIPRLDIDNERLTPIEGDMVNPANLPSGCYFHPRCRYKKDICINKKPKFTGINHGYSCHFSFDNGE